jgi:hypothetical protein
LGYTISLLGLSALLQFKNVNAAFVGTIHFAFIPSRISINNYLLDRKPKELHIRNAGSLGVLKYLQLFKPLSQPIIQPSLV